MSIKYKVYAGDFVKGIKIKEDYVGTYNNFVEARKVAYDIAKGWCEDEKPKLVDAGHNSLKLYYETGCDYGSIIQGVE